MANKKVFSFPGKKANVSWNSGLCIHIGECGQAKGDLFTGGRKPWCQPDLASDSEVKDIVMRCPTGALSVDFIDSAYSETAHTENSIHVAYDGPLFVRGKLDIEAAPSDAPGLKFRAALCRCGQSKNKPFCDNSHESDGFKDYGAVGETGDTAVDLVGPLSIKAVTDGPLMIKGNVAIFSSSGRESWRGSQVALCRCGASKNKPFCDGSHQSIGFKG